MTLFGRLQTRLNLTLVLLAFIPLLIVSGLISQRSIISLQQAAQTALLERSRHIASEINAFIEGRAGSLLYMAQVNGIPDDDQSALINAMLAFDTTFQQITVLDVRGMEVARVSRSEIIQPEDYRDRSTQPEYQAIANGEVPIYYSNVRFDAKLREPLMTIAVPVIDRRTGQLSKVLVADFRFRSVWELLGSQDYRPGETAYVVDESGAVVAHRNRSATLRDALRTTGFTIPETVTGIGTDASGQDVLYAIDLISVGLRDFIVVTEQTTDEALSLAHDIRVITGTVLALLLVIVAGLIFLVVRYFVQPVAHLSMVAERIAAGDLSLRASVPARGEITALAGAFNAMADQLASVIADLEKRIVELRHKEKVIHQAEERYRTVADFSTEWTYWEKPDGSMQYVSPVCEQITGYTADQIRADPTIIRRLIVEEDRAVWDSHHHGEADDKDLQFRIRDRDGNVRWIEHACRPVFAADDQFDGYRVSNRDITERKQTEELLHIKDSAIASTITPIALFDLEGQLTYVNDAFVKLWKLSSERDAIGRLLTDFWDSFEAGQQVIAVLHEADNYVGEFTTRLADGTRADILLTATTVRDKSGNLLCMMGSFDDVTSQKQAEAVALENERLRARFQKEQERNVLVQRIISTLSHDLRTSLAVIYTSKDLLSRYGDQLTADRRHEKLESIGRQAQFALELVEDTVNLARGNLTDAPFRPMPVNIAALCQVSVNEIRSTDRRLHELRFVSLHDPGTVRIDEVLVSRILLNLLSNAIKYSPSGTEVRLELDREDDWIVLRVVDHGVGISATALPHIFDPFYRASDVRTIDGSGLGLSIVKDCVERHHGRIYVRSQPQRGSTFTVQLPYERVDQIVVSA
ncbi:MAG: ATP-binding protein [Chloroflexota bacterium]